MTSIYKILAKVKLVGYILAVSLLLITLPTLAKSGKDDGKSGKNAVLITEVSVGTTSGLAEESGVLEMIIRGNNLCQADAGGVSIVSKPNALSNVSCEDYGDGDYLTADIDGPLEAGSYLLVVDASNKNKKRGKKSKKSDKSEDSPDFSSNKIDDFEFTYGIAGADGADSTVAGPQGLAGADGADGPPGADGAQGLAGADGDEGAAGADGAQGLAGADGADGPTGPQGPHDRPGPNNTAVGVLALASNTTGGSNTASGEGALFNNITGDSNIAIGKAAGINLTTGSNNIMIGNMGVEGEESTIRIGNTDDHVTTYLSGEVILQASFKQRLDVSLTDSVVSLRKLLADGVVTDAQLLQLEREILDLTALLEEKDQRLNELFLNLLDAIGSFNGKLNDLDDRLGGLEATIF